MSVRGRRRASLTEVVVVLRLARVADLLDVDVGGSGWDADHRVVAWSPRTGGGGTGGEEEEEEIGQRSGGPVSLVKERFHHSRGTNKKTNKKQIFNLLHFGELSRCFYPS